jgi:chemotaxis protein MotA
MNISVIIGLTAGFSVLILAVIIAGGSVLMFWDAPSVMVTVGGGFCALMVAYPLPRLAQIPGLMRLTIFPPSLILLK